MLYDEAKELSDKIKRNIKFEKTNNFKVYVTGSVARKEEKVKDIDFLIVTNNFIEDILSSLYFTERSGIIITKIYSCGERKCSIRLKVYDKSLKIDLFYALERNKAFALLTWIGPRVYAIRLRVKASKLGLLLNQYGLWDRNTNERIKGTFKTQSDIQKFLGVTVRPAYQRR